MGRRLLSDGKLGSSHPSVGRLAHGTGPVLVVRVVGILGESGFRATCIKQMAGRHCGRPFVPCLILWTWPSDRWEPIGNSIPQGDEFVSAFGASSGLLRDVMQFPKNRRSSMPASAWIRTLPR
jgi:hypothetical protein